MFRDARGRRGLRGLVEAQRYHSDGRTQLDFQLEPRTLVRPSLVPVCRLEDNVFRAPHDGHIYLSLRAPEVSLSPIMVGFESMVSRKTRP
jgi:hypothetical protein